MYLNERKDLPGFKIGIDYNVWLTTQQVVLAFQKDGVEGATRIMAQLSGYLVENIKALAYRLYTIAERKGWAGEAYAYNSLVSSWMTIQDRANKAREYIPGEFDFG